MSPLGRQSVVGNLGVRLAEVFVVVCHARGGKFIPGKGPIARLLAGDNRLDHGIVTVGNFSRYWDVTEYKELLIPLGFFVFAVELFVRARREQD